LGIGRQRKKAKEKKPRSGDPRLIKIMQYLSKGNVGQARRLAELYGKEDPGFINTIIPLFMQLGKPTSAKRLLKLGMELAPDDPTSHFNMGLYHEMSEKVNEAEKNFLRCVELDPKHRGAHYHLAGIFMGKGEDEAAEDAIHDALDIDGSDPRAWNLLGTLKVKQKEYQQAEKAFKRSIKNNKKYPFAYLNLYLLYLKQGKEKEAKKINLKAEKIGIELPLKAIEDKGKPSSSSKKKKRPLISRR